MKRFRFRLEAVLSLRSLAEGSAREAFGRAQRHLAETQAARDAAARRRTELADHLAASRSGLFRPSAQAEGLFALDLARQAENEAARLVSEATAARERARLDWLAARSRLRVIEHLKERAARSHRDAADKAEQTLLDELAALSVNRASPLA